MALTIIFNHKGKEREATVERIGLLKDTGEIEFFDNVEGPKIKFYRVVLLILGESNDIEEELKKRDDGNIAFYVKRHGIKDSAVFVVTKPYIKGRKGRFGFDNDTHWERDNEEITEDLIKTSRITISIFGEEITASSETVVDKKLKKHKIVKNDRSAGSGEVKINKEVFFPSLNKTYAVNASVSVLDGVVAQSVDHDEEALYAVIGADIEADKAQMVEEYVERYERVVRLVEKAADAEFKGLRVFGEGKLPKRLDLRDFVSMVIGVDGKVIDSTVGSDFSLFVSDEEFEAAFKSAMP